MARRAVGVNQRVYALAADDPPLLANRVWGLVRAELTDELTGLPPAAPVTLETPLQAVSKRVADGGLVGLVGVPLRVFPALATRNYTVNIRVLAAGYVPVDRVFTISQQAGFPTEFAPPPVLPVDLHREPTVISGRVVAQAADGTKTPLSGAIVRITGIWRRPPPANNAVLPEAPNIVSLSPPLYARRTTAAAQCIPQDLPEVLADDKVLLADTSAGVNTIRVSNRLNVAVPSIVLIDAAKPDFREYVAVVSADGVNVPEQPALLGLSHGLRYPHRKDSLVRRVSQNPAGAPLAFAQDAIAGDTCVFLNSLAGLVSGGQIKIAGGGTDEFHRVSLFTASSDAEGYFRLPPLARVAQIAISAEHGALPPVTVEYQPNYALRENRLDFILR